MSETPIVKGPTETAVRTGVHWTHSLTRSRYVWDGILFVSFVLVMSPHATTIAGHEWLSVLFIVPFVIHLLLHWHWIIESGSRFFGSLARSNRWHFVLDSALYLLMTFAIVSGFLASEAMFQQLGFDFIPDPFWSEVHHQYSNLLFPLIGIHLAVHWQWIVRTTRRLFGQGDRHPKMGDSQ